MHLRLRIWCAWCSKSISCKHDVLRVLRQHCRSTRHPRCNCTRARLPLSTSATYRSGTPSERSRPCDHGLLRDPPLPILPAVRNLLANKTVAAFLLQVLMVHAVANRADRPLVAVIEADAAGRRSICSLLSALDVDVRDFDSAESYLAASTQSARCLIADITLPGMSGLELLRCLRARGPLPPMIVLGEDCDVRAAVAAMREGAIDFIEKPQVELAIVRRVAQLLTAERGYAS